MLVAYFVMFFALPSEKVYENIEVTSNYVTSTPKSNSNNLEKIKTLKVSEAKERTKALSKEIDNSIAATGQDSLVEGLAEDSAITAPAVLLSKIKANRTEAARQAEFSGVAQLELVVGSDGSVKNVKLRNSLPYGLDEVALRLVSESKFKPAMINNRPVASSILFKVRFESEK